MSSVTGRLAARPPLFSPDGRYLYVPCGETVRAFNSVTGSLLFTMRGHTGTVTGVALHPVNPRQVVSACVHGCVCVWDADDGTLLRRMNVGSPITHIASCALPPRASPRLFVVALESDGQQLHIHAHTHTHTHAGEAQPAAQDAPSVTKARRVSFSLPDVSSPSEPPSYPVGLEVACLRPRSFAHTHAFTASHEGTQRAKPVVSLREMDLNTGVLGREILRARGFVTGLDAHCRGVSTVTAADATAAHVVPDIVVACTVRRRMYVWRSNARTDAVTVLSSKELLSTCAIHPFDGYAVAGDVRGRIRCWFAPQFSADAGAEVNTTAAPPSSTARPIRASAADATSSAVHWHAHSVWSTAFTADGSYLVSGGEEAVAVLWKLSASAATEAATSGPQRDKKSMAFLPRLGAPIRTVGAYARADAAVTGAIMSASETTDTHVRNVPALMVALGLMDNSVVVINGSTLTEMWRSRGLAIAGLPALPPVGVLNSLAIHRALAKPGVSTAMLIAAAEQVSHAMRGGAGATFLPRAAADLVSTMRAPEKLGLGDRSTVLSATTRYLRRGLLVDPRTKAVIVNGMPGRASLQWFDPRRESEITELEVAPRNLVSRINDDPPPPVRVTHAALSHDGMCLATIEVASTLDVGTDTTTLKLWSWYASEQRFVVNTRVDTPHKTEVTCCEFHPTLRLVITGSRDRTFKLWEETTAAPLISSAKELAAAELARRKGKEGSTGADAPDAKSAAPATEAPALVWQCRSVGFFRDLPVTAAAFSADGTCLALAYGHLVTLWDWRDNTLRRVLADPTQRGSDSAAPVNFLAFAGLSAHLIVASAVGFAVWDVLSCTQLWSYSAAVSSVAADRIGLATSTRFAVVVMTDAARSSNTAPAAAVESAPAHRIELVGVPPARDATLLTFDSSSATPLLVSRLSTSSLGRAIDEKALPLNVRVPLFSVAFVPSSGSSSTGGRAHDVLVLGSLNELHRVSLPASTLGHGKEEAAAATAPATAPAASTALAPSSVASRTGLLAAATALEARPTRSAAADTLDAGIAELQFTSLLNSFGPTQALPGSTALFDSIMAALVPAAPADATERSARAEAAETVLPRVTAGGAASSVQDMLSASRIADAQMHLDLDAATSATGGVATAATASNRPGVAATTPGVPSWVGYGAVTLLKPASESDAPPPALASLTSMFTSLSEAASAGKRTRVHEDAAATAIATTATTSTPGTASSKKARRAPSDGAAASSSVPVHAGDAPQSTATAARAASQAVSQTESPARPDASRRKRSSRGQ